MSGIPPPLPDQADRDVIRTALDDTLVVEAAAGTGKTTELVARIVRLIAGGKAAIDEIVAVTFTEKAAGELKLRVREELEKARRAAVEQRRAQAAAAHTGPAPTAAAPDDARSLQPAACSPSEASATNARAALDEALAHLEEAHISTIHGFCADLLRERPVEACVDPAFEVLTETQSARLFDQAFRDWLQGELEVPSEGVRRALRRTPAWSPFGDNEDGPVDRLRRAGLELLQWRDLRAPWRREPFDRDAELLQVIDRLCAFADLTAKVSWDKDPLYVGTLSVRLLAADLRRAQAAGAADVIDLHTRARRRRSPDAAAGAGVSTASADLDGIEAALVRLAGSREFRDIGRRTGKKPDYGKGVSRAEVLQSLQALEQLLGRFARLADADLAALLQHDLLVCIDRYDELKTRAGALDFLDLLLRARNLVRDCAPVRRAFQQRFKYILVDEFQDTDPLQAEILLLLAADEGYGRQTAGHTPSQSTEPAARQSLQPAARGLQPALDWRRVPIRRGGLFVVGDPKQSIYRFRRADVGIYQEVCDLLVSEHGGRRVHLRTNFRSVPDIQHVINAAFAPVMTRDPVALQADYVPLAPWRSGSAAAQGSSPGPQAIDGAPASGDESYAVQGFSPAQRESAEGQQSGSQGRLQPGVIALPVPDPYATRNVAMSRIERSLPDAVGAWIHWLVAESGWTVTERASTGHVQGQGPSDQSQERGERRVPIEPRHICILFRRFIKFGDDITRPYIDALEARGVPHLLVGGRSFHDREEVETLRAALAAIEWPEDHLSVYATLRGALFAFGEETLLEYWHAHPRHRFHPFDVPGDLPLQLQPVGEALTFLRDLHVKRNYRPAAETVTRLLEHTRAHVGFVMRPAGERVLANVLQIAELARQYEADGGISFRGFVDALREAADRSESPEAPVVEEGSDGVRLMTVHKAKGLEFPVVVLADLTCKLNRDQPSRHIDAARNLCALPLTGCKPADLLDHQEEEVLRDAAEGVRIAYVAATRARDILVVPAVGDSPFDDGWVATLNGAIYPPVPERRDPQPAPGCPPFGTDTVRTRPDGDPARGDTVRPGLYVLRGSDVRGAGLQPNAQSRAPSAQRPAPAEPERSETYRVVWWCPHALQLDAEPPYGLRREDVVAKDAPPFVVAEARTAYDTWQSDRIEAAARGAAPSLAVRTITDWAHSDAWAPDLADLPPVEVVQLPRDGTRPKGARFGTLVHAVLASVPLAADFDQVRALTELEARIIGAPAEEVDAAATLVTRVLAHPLMQEARGADARGACRREVPVTLTLESGLLLEGVVDLAFERGGVWTVIDFKTDEEPSRELEAYSRQVGLYAAALGRISAASLRGAILVV